MWMALNSLLIDKSKWRNSISNMDTLIKYQWDYFCSYKK